jgi:hypothetical protein
MLATQGNETIVSRGVSAQGTGRHHGLAAPALEQDGPSPPDQGLCSQRFPVNGVAKELLDAVGDYEAAQAFSSLKSPWARMSLKVYFYGRGRKIRRAAENESIRETFQRIRFTQVDICFIGNNSARARNFSRKPGY